MPSALALSIPGALAAVVVAAFAFVVVIAVCFVLLRLISFVTSGSDDVERGPEPDGDPPDEVPSGD